MFNDPAWDYMGLLIVFLVGCAYYLVILLAYMADAKTQLVFAPTAQLLVFPALLTAVLFVLGLVSPIGTWAHPAYAQVSNAPMLQLFSLASLAGVCFLCSYAAAALNQLWLRGPTLGVLHAAKPCAAAWVVGLLVGGARVPLSLGRFYQTSIDFAVPDKTGVACLIDQWTNASRLLQHTEDLLLTEPKLNLVMWSETAAWYGPELRSRAEELASNYGVYLAVTYQREVAAEPRGNQTNMLDLFGPQGAVFSYQKAHPVPFGIEPGVIPGPRQIAWAAGTPWGRLGAAICFDFDFASYLHQASTHRVDVMLQASWTWGPLGHLHADMDRVRAVENGFSMVRCSSGGTSGVYDPFGNILLTSDDAGVGGFLGFVPLHARVWTVYGLIGDAFAWICVVSALMMVACLASPLTAQRALPVALAAALFGEAIDREAIVSQSLLPPTGLKASPKSVGAIRTKISHESP
jgi:apolipoprotein N-acyltransferase